MLEEARATLTDEVIELHERMLNSLFSKAKRTQAERLQQTGKLIQSKLRQYIDVGQALSDARDSGGDPARNRKHTPMGLNLSPVWMKHAISPEK